LRTQGGFRHDRINFLKRIQQAGELAFSLKPVEEWMTLAASRQIKFACAPLDLALRLDSDTNDGGEASAASGAGRVSGFARLFHGFLYL
jgi:hypothetical protein